MSRSAVASLRGLACLMLVLYHVVGGTPEQGLRLAEGPLRGMVDALAVVRMPLFALLAGALHAQSRRSGWPLMKDKFLRLIVPMLTVGTAFALVQALTPGTNASPPDWSTLHLLPVAHFWFVEALFLIFAGWTLLGQWPLLRQPAALALLAALAVIAYLAAWGSPWLSLAGAVYLLPFFGMGFWLARSGVTMRPGPGRLLLAMAGLTLVFVSAGPVEDRMTAPMLLAGLLSASALWLMPVQHRLLVWLGERSYAIFLFHVFFTAAMRLVLNKLGLSGAGPLAAVPVAVALGAQVLMGVAAGVLGPALLHRHLQPHPRLALYLLGQVPARRPPAKNQPDGAGAAPVRSREQGA